MSIRDGLVTYYNAAGVRGPAALSLFRLCGHPKEITTKHRSFSHPIRLRMGATDASLLNAIVGAREYEVELPFEPQTIVDAGANIGISSIYLAERYPRACIFAVEAEIDNFRVLQKNVASYPQILPIHMALSYDAGIVTIGLGADGASWGCTLGNPGNSVLCVSMPTFMRLCGLTKIDVLKVDIEGSEKELFESGDWTSTVRCLLIETHDRFKPGCSASVKAAMGSAKSFQRGEVTVYISQ